jgi:type VI secretion system secreted protein Hcp
MPIYMQFGEDAEQIRGNVGAGPHAGWIELNSCQIGVNRHVTNPTGRGTNREGSAPSVSEIVITKKTDASSSGLFRESLNGTGKKVIIDFVKEGEIEPYLSLTLEDTLISSYNVSGSGGGNKSAPMESLSLNFTKISYTSKPTSTTADPQTTQEKMKWSMATTPP